MFAPKLNSIEAEISSFNLTVYVFDPTYGPFVPLAETLEPLTVYGNFLDLTFWEPRRLPDVGWRKTMKAAEDRGWSLGYFENLTQLCIPFCVFARAGRITYSPHLRDLVLFSKEDTSYGLRFSGMDFPWGLVELYRLMSLKKGILLGNWNTWKSRSMTSIPAEALGALSV